MAKERTLFIKNPRAYQLASTLSKRTGQTLTEVVITALEEKVKKEPKPIDREALARLQARIAALPVLDPRPPDEIIGYDEFGLPK